MPYDGLVLAAVVQELQPLIDTRIDKIYQPLREEIHLLLRSAGEKVRLLLNTNSNLARVHLTWQSKANPTFPPVFCMVLRKHLEGGRIKAIRQIGLDRVLHLEIENRDELGQLSLKTLILEIMGKHSNLILVNEQGEILDGIRRYGHAVSRHREILPGQLYIAPPAQNKQNPLDLSEEEFFELLLSQEPEALVWQIIQQKLEALSPLTAREILLQCNLPINLAVESCGLYELRSLYVKLRQIMQDCQAGKFQPSYTEQDFAAIQLNSGQSAASMNELLEEVYAHKQQQELLRAGKQSLQSVLHKNLTRLQKKIHLQQESLTKAEAGEQYKIAGDLITANIYQLKKGDTEVLVPNYYLPDCPQVKITLQAQLTPAENAQWQYKRYNKAKQTLKGAWEQMNLSLNEQEYLQGVESSLELAENQLEIQQIRQELEAENYLKAAPAGKGARKKEKPTPLQFTSSNGMLIKVGKNNKQNDYLTLKLAKEQDLWFHVKNQPGSHVILFTEGQPVSEQDLLEAASLAAYYSKARSSSKTEVDYTLRKYVQKPNGAKPGYVIYTNQKTLLVQPQKPN